MTAVVITTTTSVPTIGGDDDTWGAILNAKWGTAKADLDALALTPANRIKGNNTGSPQGVDDLTGTQVTAMLDAVVGDAGAGGTKGLTPAPAAGDAAARKFLMASGAWVADERKAWALITGATGAVVAGRNIACTRSGTGVFDITFSTALSSASYAVLLSCQGATGGVKVATVNDTGKSTAGFTVHVVTQAAAAVDPTQLYIEVIG